MPVLRESFGTCTQTYDLPRVSQTSISWFRNRVRSAFVNRKSLPDGEANFPYEKPGNLAAGLAMCQKPRGQHFGVIHHQEVSGTQDIRVDPVTQQPVAARGVCRDRIERLGEFAAVILLLYVLIYRPRQSLFHYH